MNTRLNTGTGPEWSQAACRGKPIKYWYSNRVFETAMAIRVCKECPIREACLQHALSVPEVYGVWGGLGQVERNRLLHKLTGPSPTGTRSLSLRTRRGQARRLSGRSSSSS